MKRFILTIDEGTTSLRVVLFDVKKHKIVKLERAQTELITPKAGWVEQDANDIWDKTVLCLKKVMHKINPEDVYGLGITNQRETIVAWDKKTGKALNNAIIWKCRRTADFWEDLKQSKFAKIIQDKTGLIVNSYFSATKIKWLLNNSKSVIKALEEHRLCIGTIESYLVYRLTNHTIFVTDVTNASRTMLFNINTLKWDDELLKLFGIPRDILPMPVDNDEIVGFTRMFDKPIKIAGLIGDQQSSLLGQGCFNKGQIKNTYGTGSFMLANIGHDPIKSQNNLLTTIAYKINGVVSYALEGSVFSCGSIINEAIKRRLAPNHRKLTRLASKVRESNLYLIPAFNGLGCPYWIMDAHEQFINKTKNTSNQEIAKACWDSIAYRSYDVFEAMMKDINLQPTKLCVDGGLSRNRYLMQLQSNLLQLPISIVNLESTAIGSIICTGIATSAFKFDDFVFKPIKTFTPSRTQEQIQPVIDGWKGAMKEYLEGLNNAK